MDKKIRFSYDKTGDILDISIGAPRKAISKEIRDGFFIRVDPETNEILGFSVLNFEKSFGKSANSKSIPVSAKFAFVA
jgi:hypothetical protein